LHYLFKPKVSAFHMATLPFGFVQGKLLAMPPVISYQPSAMVSLTLLGLPSGHATDG
jgi:hypothetical protein